MPAFKDGISALFGRFRGDVDCQNLTVRGSISGRHVLPTWVARTALGDPGADLTTTAGSATEISSRLRTTIVVPPSGIVRASCAMNVRSSGGGDAYLFVQILGGIWQIAGALALDTTSVGTPIPGAYVFTGLPAGKTTFTLGWDQVGGVTLTIPAHTRGAAQQGTWLQVEGVP